MTLGRPRHVEADIGEGRAPGAAVFSLVQRLYADPVMARIFSEELTIQRWLEVERALAKSQASLGILAAEDARAIDEAAVPANVDPVELWVETRNVGYPILPLIRMLVRRLPEQAGGRLHYGATTQDIMDTALALQLREALFRLEGLVSCLGAAVAVHVERHGTTVMAGRTHAQQAVPTTFGAVMATYLSELARHRQRVEACRSRACRVSAFGAGGTAAAYGPLARELRARLAAGLGLDAVDVPWHTSRDGVAEFGSLCGLLAGTCGRLAQEIIGLSRTEIGEVSEAIAHHRGASSTMPQKANPVLSEAIVGMAATCGPLAGALFRSMESGHERAAGEWHIEWQVVPQVAVLAASALSLAIEAVDGLVVYPDQMAANLRVDGGALMAEAYMMQLAEEVGQTQAHDLVYAAVRAARAAGCDLYTTLAKARAEVGEPPPRQIAPGDYVGEAEAICATALEEWAAAQAPGMMGDSCHA